MSAPAQPSHEVIRHCLEKVSPKEVAAELGVSLSLVYKWAQPPEDNHGSGARNPLDRLRSLIELSGDAGPAEWLAEVCGGYLVRNPASACERGFQVLPATHELVTQFADLLQTVSRAAADNRISKDEAREIRTVWTRLKSYAEGFVTCCEEEDFDPIRHAGEAPKSAPRGR